MGTGWFAVIMEYEGLVRDCLLLEQHNRCSRILQIAVPGNLAKLARKDSGLLVSFDSLRWSQMASSRFRL